MNDEVDDPENEIHLVSLNAKCDYQYRESTVQKGGLRHQFSFKVQYERLLLFTSLLLSFILGQRPSF